MGLSFRALRPRFKNPSLRSLLIVPFVVQLVLAIALTGYLSLRSGQGAVNGVAQQLRGEITGHIIDQLGHYLAVPQQINRLNVRAMQQGTFPVGDWDAIEQYFLQQAQDFGVIDSIYYGTPTGEFGGAGWLSGRDRPLQVMRVRAEQPQLIQFYDVEVTGQLTPVIETPGFDVTQRPWYTAAVNQSAPTWGQIFPYHAFPAMAIPAAAPVYDEAGNLQGVFANNFFLSRVSDFLRTLKIGYTGQAFIFDDQGLLVASSSLEQPFWVEAGKATRMPLAAAPDRPLQAAAAAISAHWPNLALITGTQNLDFELEGDRYFLQVTEFRDRYGLDWLIGVVIPEADFLGPLQAHRATILGLSVGSLLASLCVGLYTSRWISVPMRRLDIAAKRLAGGNFQQRLPTTGIQELNALTVSFQHMAGQLQQSFTALQQQAFHDELTGLPNRSALIEELNQCIARQMRDRTQHFAVLFVDLDNFKLVNDSMGHLAGDRLLIATARRFSSVLPAHTFISRFGGDEFVIVGQAIAAVEDATRIAAALSNSLRQPFQVGDRGIHIAASIGIVLSTIGSQDADEFLRNADIALYKAKADGKARYEVFSYEMYIQINQRLQLETALRESIHQEALDIAYQPIVALGNGAIVGFEALCRWHHPQLGQVAPIDFIPVAEETGLIIPLERQLLHYACAQMRHWQQQFPNSGVRFMSVNVSALHVMHATFLENIRQVLQVTGLSPTALKLEVTESLMIQNPVVARACLQRLRSLGVQLSLDDFGTGYSSLSYLHQFPFNTLKIDKTFVQQVSVDPADQGIVKAIIAMAQSLEIDIIAEGIETQAEAVLLQQLGCHYGQGYYFSRPASCTEATKFLQGVPHLGS